MEPRIVEAEEIKLVGMNEVTSLERDNPALLWRSFMPRHNEVKHIANQNFYALQVYGSIADLKKINPKKEFEKWAAVEVKRFDPVPEGMKALTLAPGRYAVFGFKGMSKDFYKVIAFLYGSVMPNSIYEFDDRPHFQLMGEKYLGQDNPDSEEDIWIPIK